MRGFLILMFFLLFLFPSWGFSLEGEVIEVFDGDTILVLSDGQQIKVRLYCIDAPELLQPYGRTAKEFLSRILLGKKVKVKERGIDQYGRVLGEVFLDGEISINEELVKNGMAWVYKKYCKIPSYFALEKTARQNRIGLWEDENPIPPWEYRKKERERGVDLGNTYFLLVLLLLVLFLSLTWKKGKRRKR
jgi:endonuclease YncB( thermonuclease family)